MEYQDSSVPIMLNYLSSLIPGSSNLEACKSVFSHENYQFEMRRYGLSPTDVEHLIWYFANLQEIRTEDIPDLCQERKNALRDKHTLWLDCLKNPQTYQRRYEQVRGILYQSHLEELERRLASDFPQAIDIDDAKVILTLSFGPSFGYVFEKSLHLDLFGIGKYCSLDELPCIILHEMHHLQIQKIIGNYQSFIKGFSMLEEYIFRFTGEGLAVKFCNNAEGILSKRIYPDSAANIGIPSMPVLNKHFSEHLSLFEQTVNRIISHDITGKELEEQFKNVWWNPYLYQDEEPFLAQTPIYSFGNELFGSIYDRFGIDILFQCFYHPMEALRYFCDVLEHQRGGKKVIAQKIDWKTVEIPSQTEHFIIERELSAAELDAVKKGHKPQEMEDKWFMYYEDGRLYIHQSWTGFCIYIIDLSQEGKLDVIVNRSPKQYKETSKERDCIMVSILINRLIGKHSENAELMKKYLSL